MSEMKWNWGMNDTDDQKEVCPTIKSKKPNNPNDFKEIPKRCLKELGRDLCLFSLPESKCMSSPPIQTCNTVRRYYRNMYIKHKYYTSMYMLSKWSLFIRGLFKNQTVDKFCSKLEDGTYIMGIPATSNAIQNVFVSLNMEDNELVNPNQASVSWITFETVIEAMDIANYLQIQHLLDRCGKVIVQAFPAKIGTDRDKDKFKLDKNKDYGYNSSKWSVCIQKVQSVKDKKIALYTAEHILTVVNYLQNRDFSWSQRSFKVNDYIHRLLLAFLSIDLDLMSIEQKIVLLNKNVKTTDYAYRLFVKMAFMTFAKGGPTTVE